MGCCRVMRAGDIRGADEWKVVQNEVWKIIVREQG